MYEAPRPLHVALTSVPLFKASTATPNVLAAVADVTGIPAATLQQTERRMARLGSLAPLRELFRNPDVPKTDGLRYELTVKQLHKGARSGLREQMAQRLTLTLSSARGQIQVRLTVVLGRRELAAYTERQVAQICISYKIDAGSTHQAYKHEVTIAGDRPRTGMQRAKAA